MHISSLSLAHFRNFTEKKLEFDPNITLILGNNAIGKTNVLEALYFACTGQGIKDAKQEELIMFQHDEATVTMEVEHEGVKESFRVIMKKNLEKGTTLKAYFVGRAKKLLHFYTQYTPPVVLFAPTLIDVVNGANSEKRKYLDSFLSKIDKEYKKKLNNYESGLRKRNKVLERAENPDRLRDELQFWNDYLIEQSHYIYEKREWLAEELNKVPNIASHTFQLQYEKNSNSPARFEDYFMKEFYQKRTLVGPHRDEIKIYKKYDEKKMIDVQKFASRGEQRLALLWLMLCEIELYKAVLGKDPLVLLDDIFSELDDANKKIVTHLMERYQTVITSTEDELKQWPEFKGHILNISS